VLVLNHLFEFNLGSLKAAPNNVSVSTYEVQYRRRVLRTSLQHMSHVHIPIISGAASITEMNEIAMITKLYGSLLL
jgi:hypothetical protein